MSYFTNGGLSVNLGSYSGGGYCSTGTYGGNGSFARVTQTDVNDLIRYIEDGNAKQVMQKYNQLNLSGNAIVRNRIETYFQRNYGMSLTSALDEKAGSSFVSGLSQGTVLFGLFDDGLSGDEVESMITGVDERSSSKVAEYAGGIISGGVSGAAIAAGAACLFCPAALPAVAIVGAIGGVVNGICTVFSKDQQNKKTAMT